MRFKIFFDTLLLLQENMVSTNSQSDIVQICIVCIAFYQASLLLQWSLSDINSTIDIFMSLLVFSPITASLTSVLCRLQSLHCTHVLYKEFCKKLSFKHFLVNMKSCTSVLCFTLYHLHSPTFLILFVGTESGARSWNCQIVGGERAEKFTVWSCSLQHKSSNLFKRRWYRTL